MENRVSSDWIALSELRKEMELSSLLSVREQEKTLHALFRRSVGEIPYERFKQLAYFGGRLYSASKGGARSPTPTTRTGS